VPRPRNCHSAADPFSPPISDEAVNVLTLSALVSRYSPSDHSWVAAIGTGGRGCWCWWKPWHQSPVGLLAGLDPIAEALGAKVDSFAEEGAIALAHDVLVQPAVLVVLLDHRDLLRRQRRGLSVPRPRLSR